jgi:RND family efflux transporter MFP subunit
MAFFLGTAPGHCLLALMVFLSVFFYCSSPCNGQPAEKKGPVRSAPVEVATVVQTDLADRVSLVGTAEPWLETRIASQTEGLVVRMHVDEGDRVEKGQVICELDGTELRLRIAAAKAAFAEAEVSRRRAARDLERQKRLFSIESVSEKAYEDARFEVEAADKKLSTIEAETAVLEDQLKKKQIIAPALGVVVRRHALVGQWLGEGGGVVTMVELDPIRLMVPVPERYVAGLKTGNPVQVTFDALPKRSYEGRIAAVIPLADPAARTFPVRIHVPNREGAVKGGMLGRVELPVGTPRKALVVPKDALVIGDEGTAVFVVQDRKAQRIPVKTGSATGSYIEVLGGLKAGASVVVRGNERLIPGQPVEIVGPKAPEARRPSP